MGVKEKHAYKRDGTVEVAEQDKDKDNEPEQQNVVIFIITLTAKKDPMALGQRRPDHKSGKIKAVELISRNLIRPIHQEDAIRINKKIISLTVINGPSSLGQDQTDAGLPSMYIELWSELSLRTIGGVSLDQEAQFL